MTRYKLPLVILALLALGTAGYIMVADAHQPRNAAPAAMSRDGQSRPDPEAPQLQVGGPFTLTNQDGQPVTEQSFHGKYMLIFFGFTYCPDICPTELQDALNAIEIAGSEIKSQVQPIFITIDPARDTTDKMSEYVKMFGRGLIGLTGTPEQIAAVARAYKVYYAKTADEDGESSGDDYMMDHSSFLYLMGPDGQMVKTFAPGTTLDDLAAGLKQYVAPATTTPH